MISVTLLLNHLGQPLAAFASHADAQARCDKYNADPFLEPDKPDPDAPYSIETWSVDDDESGLPSSFEIDQLKKQLASMTAERDEWMRIAQNAMSGPTPRDDYDGITSSMALDMRDELESRRDYDR